MLSEPFQPRVLLWCQLEVDPAPTLIAYSSICLLSEVPSASPRLASCLMPLALRLSGDALCDSALEIPRGRHPIVSLA